MVSRRMKPTKFDKEHKEALLDPGAIIILENAEQFLPSWYWQRLKMLPNQWYKVGLQRGQDFLGKLGRSIVHPKSP